MIQVQCRQTLVGPNHANHGNPIKSGCLTNSCSEPVKDAIHQGVGSKQQDKSHQGNPWKKKREQAKQHGHEPTEGECPPVSCQRVNDGDLPRPYKMPPTKIGVKGCSPPVTGGFRSEWSSSCCRARGIRSLGDCRGDAGRGFVYSGSIPKWRNASLIAARLSAGQSCRGERPSTDDRPPWM